MALSSNSKKGLALGALLPVLLSVYSESRKQAETQAQRAAAHIEERQKHREAVQARDLDGAQKFLVQVTGDSADPADTRRDGSFCDHVYIASELVRLTAQSTATQAAVVGALQYRSEQPLASDAAATTPNLPPRICDCPATLEQMQSNWRPGKKGTMADTAVIKDMATTLDAVASKCSDDTAGHAPVIVGAEGPGPGAAAGESGRGPASAGAAAAPQLPSATTAAGGTAASAASSTASAATCPAASPDDGTPVRVYVQIAREDQRSEATALQNRLRGDGYIVPGIERVGAGASPAQMQVRYVFSEDCTDARKLRDDVQSAVSSDRSPELAPPLSQYRGHSLHRSFEVWFPK